MKKILTLSVAVLLATVAPASPCEQAALKPNGTADISNFLKLTVDEKRVPGVVALVVGCEGPLYQGAFGMQDVRRGIEMHKESIFRIASMTKPLTSLALMRLVEQKKVALEDEARVQVPWLNAPHVIHDVDLAAQTFLTRPARSPITVRQLLTHTSGIGYSWSDPALALAEKYDPDQTYLLADPGTRWIYGAGAKALGDIIISVTGQPFDRALKDLVLDPIGAIDTAYSVPPSKRNRVATVHRRDGQQLIEESNPRTLEGYVSADGNLFSTAQDYGRFIRLILREGRLEGTPIVSPQTVRAMAAPQMGGLRVEQQPAANLRMSRSFPLGAGVDTWGFGFQISAVGSAPYRRSAGSLSWAGLFNTHFWIDPARGIGAVLLMQILPFYDEEAIKLLQGFEQQVYQNLEPAG